MDSKRRYPLGGGELELLKVERLQDTDMIFINTNGRTIGLTTEMAKNLELGLQLVLSGEYEVAETTCYTRLEEERKARLARMEEQAKNYTNTSPPTRNIKPNLDQL